MSSAMSDTRAHCSLWKESPNSTTYTVQGVPERLDKAVHGIKNADTVIVGHNPVGTWAKCLEQGRPLTTSGNAGRPAISPDGMFAALP
jgi:hypothetical protein